MTTLPDLFLSGTRTALVGAIWIYALTTIYQLCGSVWSYIRLLLRMKWPNLTLKVVQHPKFFRTVLYSKEFLSILHDVTQKDATSEYETSLFMFGSRIHLLTYSGDYAQALLTSPHCMNKAVRYSPIRETVGECLLTAPASEYRETRKMFMPIFHNRMIAAFMPSMNKHILETVSQLEKYVNKGEFVVESYVERCVVMCNADFFVGTPMYDEEIDCFIQLMHNLSTILFANMIRWWKLPSQIYNMTATGRAQKKCMQEAEQLFHKVIRRREDVLAQKNAGLGLKIEPSTEEDNGTGRILVDILLDPERKNGGDTFAELVMFGKASSSTTVHTINAALMMLAYHPEEQRKVYQELYDIYGSANPEDVPVLQSDHQRMHCMKRLIKETMRLFPGIPIIARSVEEDIRIDDQTIPKGCDACIFIYGMHRSEKYWTNPLKFDPDRFLPENSVDRSPWVYLPFSEGPRKCPAYTMALDMITQFLATILRKYIISSDSITLVKDIQMTVDIVSHFIEPVKIKIERRQPVGSTKSTAEED